MLKELLQEKLGNFTNYEYKRALEIVNEIGYKNENERAELMCSYIHIFRLHKEEGELNV